MHSNVDASVTLYDHGRADCEPRSPTRRWLISAKVTNNEFNASPNTATLSTPILPVSDLAITQFTAAPRSVVYGNEHHVHGHGHQPRAVAGDRRDSVTLPMPAFTTFVSGSWTMQSARPMSTGTVDHRWDPTWSPTIGHLAVGLDCARSPIVVTPQQDAVGTLNATVTASARPDSTQTASAATNTLQTTVQDQPGDLQFSAAELRSARKRRFRDHHRDADGRAAWAGLGQFHDGSDDRDGRPRLHTGRRDRCVPARAWRGRRFRSRCWTIRTMTTTRLVGLAISDPAGGAVLGA